MKFRIIAAGLAGGFAILGNPAFAQSDAMEWEEGGDVGKLSISFAVAATNIEVNLENSEVVLPEDFEAGDFDVTLDENVNFTSLFTGASVSYRVLPFLSVDARAGYVSSESDFGVNIAGTPGDQFPDFFDGPIAFSAPVSTNVEGVNAGIGATAMFPAFSVGRKKVLVFGTYEHSWSEYNDENFSANYGRVGGGFVFPVSPEDPMQPLFVLGASYTNVSRRFEREFTVGEETAIVRAEQTTDHPFTIELGGVIPVSQQFRIGLGSSVQTTGNVSFLVTLTITP